MRVSKQIKQNIFELEDLTVKNLTITLITSLLSTSSPLVLQCPQRHAPHAGHHSGGVHGGDQVGDDGKMQHELLHYSQEEYR